MSACRFQFDFPGSSESLVDKIRARMVAEGGRFDGTAAEGRFSLPTPIGEFAGGYSIVGATIWVEVDDKPIFVPCKAIEAKLGELVRAHR